MGWDGLYDTDLEELPEGVEEALEVFASHRKTDNLPIRLTHGDLNNSNILVQDENISGIIDWGCAGWYPAYWEYAKCVAVTQGLHCGRAYARKYLEDFDEEGANLNKVLDLFEQ